MVSASPSVPSFTREMTYLTFCSFIGSPLKYIFDRDSRQRFAQFTEDSSCPVIFTSLPRLNIVTPNAFCMVFTLQSRSPNSA